MFISTRCVGAIALAGMLALGTAELSAQGRAGGGGGGGAPPPTAYRQSIMQGFSSHSAAIRTIVAGTAGQPSHLAGHATALQALTAMLADAFPAGSGSEMSRARPEIWENQPEFTARVQAIQTAANALVEATRSGDNGQVGEAMQAVQQNCNGCHMQFRGPPIGGL